MVRLSGSEVLRLSSSGSSTLDHFAVVALRTSRLTVQFSYTCSGRTLTVPTVPKETPVTLLPCLQLNTIQSLADPERHNGSSLDCPFSW